MVARVEAGGICRASLPATKNATKSTQVIGLGDGAVLQTLRMWSVRRPMRRNWLGWSKPMCSRRHNFRRTPLADGTNNPPCDRHQRDRTQKPTVSSLFYDSTGCPRCKTKRLSVTCSPRTIKIRRRWRNFLSSPKTHRKTWFWDVISLEKRSRPYRHPFNLRV